MELFFHKLNHFIIPSISYLSCSLYILYIIQIMCYFLTSMCMFFYKIIHQHMSQNQHKSNQFHIYHAVHAFYISSISCVIFSLPVACFFHIIINQHMSQNQHQCLEFYKKADRSPNKCTSQSYPHEIVSCQEITMDHIGISHQDKQMLCVRHTRY